MSIGRVEARKKDCAGWIVSLPTSEGLSSSVRTRSYTHRREERFSFDGAIARWPRCLCVAFIATAARHAAGILVACAESLSSRRRSNRSFRVRRRVSRASSARCWSQGRRQFLPARSNFLRVPALTSPSRRRTSRRFLRNLTFIAVAPRPSFPDASWCAAFTVGATVSRSRKGGLSCLAQLDWLERSRSQACCRATRWQPLMPISPKSVRRSSNSRNRTKRASRHSKNA